MSFWDETFDTAKELFDTASKKTTQAVEIGKINLAISKAKAELAKKYETLGRLYFQTRQGEADEEGLDLLAAEVEQAAAKLSFLKDQLQRARQMQICSACGQKNPASADYCNRCGKAL
jgi:multidrug resistance efflux pump